MSASAKALARMLHDSECQSMSWNDGCRDGTGDHVRSRLTDARRILASADPAEEIHAEICSAETHSIHHPAVGIRCTHRDEHINTVRVWLVGQSQLGLFEDAA